jgi:hypothetical protein
MDLLGTHTWSDVHAGGVLKKTQCILLNTNLEGLSLGGFRLQKACIS